MPLSPMQFPILPSSVPDLMGNFNEGYNQQLARQLQQMQMERLKAEMPYFARQKEAEVGKAEADLQGQQQKNKYFPQEQESVLNSQRIKSQFDQMKLKYPGLGEPGLVGQLAYGAMIKDNPQMAQTYNLLQKAINADINNKQELANWRKSGGFGSMGVDQRNLQGFVNQIRNDNPGFTPEQVNEAASAYLEGNEVDSQGNKLPPLSGLANQQLLNVTGKNVPSSLKTQYANLDILVNDLNDFDINAIKSFSGLGGKARLLKAKTQMAINPDDPSIDPMARRFFTAMNQSIINMDSMRKAFGTSVVPDYVYKTLGRLSNPNSDIWNDPKQVQENWDAVVNQLSKNRDYLGNKVRRGVTASMPEKGGSNSSGNHVSQNTKLINGKTYSKINGQWYEE